MWEAFAMQKLLNFFQKKKYWHILDINNVWNFNETLTNNVSFEQPDPAIMFLCVIPTATSCEIGP